MSLTHAELRPMVQWHQNYRPEWDDTPDEYEQEGVVGWGRSRRLGLYRSERVKAYLGVQHVDTTRAAWHSDEEPHARFFLSLFLDGRVVTLRTFAKMEACLDELARYAVR